ncbi:MAG: hypothetical protein ACOCR8_00145 [Desulfosalsimonas sp.]
MIDFQTLGKALSSAGLAEKPVNQYSKQEVETLVQACLDSLRPDKDPEFKQPYIDQQGELHIPFDSDPKYWWWAPCGQSLFATLRELGASEETFRKYVTQEDIPF